MPFRERALLNYSSSKKEETAQNLRSSRTPKAMSSPSSPTLDEVIEKIMENVQGERVEQLEN